MNKETNDGIKVYTPLALKLYDWWVLRISNRYAWQCQTQRHLVPHFRNNMKSNHLDVGVGTGFYLTYAPDICSVSLMDLNASSLDAATARVGKDRIKASVLHDVFNPYPAHLHNQFDSISMLYLLHCLPGTMKEKAPVIHRAADALTRDGVLFGATILGDEANHNAFGRKLMAVYNKKGIFSNRADGVEDLRTILSAAFDRVDIKVEGKVALFKAERKKG
ncbi:class I SAM-dependent methyltransferase [uncultured Enterobacter sp.]|uniref:class I SAM-dependent methyltransferase n=1 Tax=uncultured Enterobacter sp. TaxID=238202 RepID=UPI00262129A2|nr:class I SAM-dependent methyltransferase [uncultured Enterobacter sp.]